MENANIAHKLLDVAGDAQATRTDEERQEIILRALANRFDVGETALIARALLYVEKTLYDVKYPQFKARQLIPVSNEIDPGAEQYAYHQFDGFGMAKIVANYANDFPRVDAIAREFIANIKSLGDSYGYTIQDLRRAAFAQRNGVPVAGRIDTKRAEFAKRGIEAAIDEIAAKGSTEGNLPGFANHANVPVVVPITGNWASATPAQIIADMNYAVQSMITLTNQVEYPDTIVLPPAAFAIVSQTPYSAYTAVTILQWFMNASPYVQNVESWYKLSTANAAGNGPRMVVYRRSPDVLQLQIPQEFEQFQPEVQGLQFKIPCHARIGGVQVTYPLAMNYMDGI